MNAIQVMNRISKFRPRRRPRLLGSVTLLATGVVLLTGCGADAEADGPEAGWARGTVTDARGNPLHGTEVRVEGTGIQGGIVSYTVRTNTEGRYETRLADGHYAVQAYHPVTYHEEEYWIPLAPVDGDSRTDQDSEAGIVEDFVWKVSGPIGGGTDQYHGGDVDVDFAVNPALGAYPRIPQESTVQLTLAPVGPLVDGSTGETQTFTYTTQAICPSDPASCGYETAEWSDIPVGRYTITGQLVGPDGSTTPLRVSTRHATSGGGAFQTEFAPTAIVQFTPNSSTGLHSGVGSVGVRLLP